MSNSALALSGVKDIHSSGAEYGFVSKAMIDEAYYSPENQINKTQKYNEMDFYRIQNGKRKQPDYIIVFRKKGKVKYMDEAKIAQEQWNGLPIVIVDEDKCLEAERQKVYEMRASYEAGDKSLAGPIYQKVRNNRVTRSSFCEDIDLEKFIQEAEIQEKQSEEQPKVEEEKQVGIKDLEENYDRVTPQERKEEASTIRRIYAKVQEITKGKEY